MTRTATGEDKFQNNGGPSLGRRAADFFERCELRHAVFLEKLDETAIACPFAFRQASNRPVVRDASHLPIIGRIPVNERIIRGLHGTGHLRKTASARQSGAVIRPNPQLPDRQLPTPEPSWLLI